MEELLPQDMGEHGQDSRRYLTFCIDDETYAVSLFSVKEIIAPQRITPIPNAPMYVRGVINLRGSIIPLINIRYKFSLEDKPFDSQTAIIIYEIEDRLMGFIVDKVEDVLTAQVSSIKSAPSFSTEVDTSFIDGIIEIDEGISMILNLAEVFDAQELLDINRAHELIASEEDVDGEDAFEDEEKLEEEVS